MDASNICGAGQHFLWNIIIRTGYSRARITSCLTCQWNRQSVIHFLSLFIISDHLPNPSKQTSYVMDFIHCIYSCYPTFTVLLQDTKRNRLHERTCWQIQLLGTRQVSAASGMICDGPSLAWARTIPSSAHVFCFLSNGMNLESFKKCFRRHLSVTWLPAPHLQHVIAV